MPSVPSPTVSAFSDKSHSSTDQELRAVLGKAYDPWRTLLSLLAEAIESMNEVWGFTSASTGWGLRVRQKERVILYMTPQHNQFRVSFALGEKAVAAAHAAKLSAAVKDAIDAAPRYAEGRGVRFEIKSSRLLPSLVTLARIKKES